MYQKQRAVGWAFLALTINASLVVAQCEVTELTAGDAAWGDRFGWSLSRSGDYLLVGARSDDLPGALTEAGSANVFFKIGGTWIEQYKLVASDASQHDYFGDSVSIDWPYAVVGAYGNDEAGSFSGSAYVFRHEDNGTPEESGDDTWLEMTPPLVASDAAAEDFFGGSVCISGDYAVVGASRDDDACPGVSGCDSGSAYVFRRDDNSTPSNPTDDTWIEQAKLTASDAEEGDRFGMSVYIDGDYIVVGAIGDDDGGNTSGCAYVFRRDDNGTPGDPGDDTWVEMSPKLMTITAGSGDQFGVAVGMDGEFVVVGAQSGDAPGAPGAGSAHMFRRDDNGTPTDPGDDTWIEIGLPLTASDAATNDYFGWSVSISGDYAAVGARWDDDTGGSSGSAYVFRRDDNGTPAEPGDDMWLQEAKLVAADSDGANEFGVSVSIDAEDVIVGAQLGDAPGAQNSGSVYVFRVLGTPDCNSNGVNDACELYGDDCNSNGVPDECEAEFTSVELFVAQLLAESQDPDFVCMYDQDDDGILNGADIWGFVDRLLQA